MRPDERDIEDELRGHLELNIKERIERGEEPAAARRAALAELGYIPAVRESVRRVGEPNRVALCESLELDEVVEALVARGRGD